MKKKAMMCMVAALCLGSTMTAYAAPEVMPDGTVFDAEYYAQTYPDVVAALGTGTDALYQHYVIFGQLEGRLAYDGAVPFLVDETDFTVQAEDEPEILGIQGVHEQWYDLPTWGEAEAYEGSNAVDKMITMSVRTEVPDSDEVKGDMERLAQYTTEGYEWRPVFYIVAGEVVDHASWWANYYWYYDVAHSKDWTSPEEDVAYNRKFTVTWNGVDYTECKVARSLSTGQYSDVAVDDGFWFLLPKGYDGKVYLAIKGAMLDEYGTTANDDAAVTFLY